MICNVSEPTVWPIVDNRAEIKTGESIKLAILLGKDLAVDC